MLRTFASLALALAPLASAQTPAHPAFEVVSVKPSAPSSQGRGMIQGGPGTTDPDRFVRTRTTIQALLREAYDVDFDQIQGPGWIADERYDVQAKLPAGVSKDELKLMLRDLLADRFKLTLHQIKKDFPVYELTIAKGGLKIHENTDQNLQPMRPGDASLAPDKDGFPQIPPGKSGSASRMSNGLNYMTAQGMPLSLLVFQVGTQLGSMTGANTYAPGRIVDKTGLTGKYDFKLEYAGSVGIGGAFSLPVATDTAEPSGGLTLVDFMEKQLGLKLTKSTAPRDVLVIDHVDKTPTEN